MSGGDFYTSPRGQSIVKTRIVAKYFGAWTRIMLPRVRNLPDGRIAYIDLFAGRGQFDDGTPSTPLWVLQNAVKDQELRQRLVTWFNDKDPDHIRSLQKCVSCLPLIDTLVHQPTFTSYEVGSEIVSILRRLHLVPTLFFIDPWGYKGLSLELIGSAIKHWGCDCIFFFNYNRINPGLKNPTVFEHMNDLFGLERANDLREKVEGLAPFNREMTIVNELAEGLQDVGGQYVLPFTFKTKNGKRTSHHLIFVSKNFRGYDIMKDVMASVSQDSQDGVAEFEYNPATSRQLRLLYDFGHMDSIQALKNALLETFQGRTLTLERIYEIHSARTRYRLPNYREALLQLESEAKVTVDVPPEKRRRHQGKLTLGEKRKVTFL